MNLKIVLHQKLLQEECSLGTGAIGILTVSLTPAQPETLCKGAGETLSLSKLLQRHLDVELLGHDFIEC